MKPSILFLLFHLFLFTQNASAQQTIPPFKMTMTNGKVFTAANLQKGKPVVLIYFAPDCEHCQVLMNAFFKKADAFKKTQVVLVTFKPMADVAGFEKAYHTAKYPNIKVGTEGMSFYLRYYYKLEKTPFTALFNKKGNLVYSYRDETPVDDLVKRVKTL